MKIHEVAGNIMHKMDAFKGSRQAMDTPQCSLSGECPGRKWKLKI